MTIQSVAVWAVSAMVSLVGVFGVALVTAKAMGY